MYYYGYNGGYNNGYYNPCCNTGYAGTTNGGWGAALWIVLFILLVIIIGAGWSWNNNHLPHDRYRLFPFLCME